MFRRRKWNPELLWLRLKESKKESVKNRQNRKIEAGAAAWCNYTLGPLLFLDTSGKKCEGGRAGG